MSYYCFSRVRPVAAWFLQFCWLETHILAGIDFLNLVINWAQLWPFGGYSSGEMKLRVLRNSCWTVLHAPCTGACMSCVAERQIILLSTTRLITFVEIVRYPTNTVLWLFTWGSTRNNSHFGQSDRHHDRLGKRWVYGVW